MRNIFKDLIYLVFIALISCVRQTPDYPTIKLMPEEFADFSDANVTALGVLEFENPENGFLGFIHKAVGHEGNYYLINNTGEFLELLKYNNDGSYVKRIGGIGRGPSEYIIASDFAIEHPTGNILVINHSNEILKYSKNGDFLGEAQTGIMSSSFELATEG
ncbi:MAG: 6-bladed beta-propeller, partial [Bacteroidetes bacterium]